MANGDLGLQQLHLDIEWRGADDAGQVAALDRVRVDHDDSADSKAGEVFDNEGAYAAKAHDGDLAGAQDVLAGGGKHAYLAVVFGVGGETAWRLGIQPRNAGTDHAIGAQRSSSAVGQPDVGPDGTAAVHECADGYATTDVEQGWIAALV